MQANKSYSPFIVTSFFSNNKKMLNYVTLFFIVIVVATLLILVRYTFSQLQWESFHKNRIQAEVLALRLDQNLQDLVDEEERRAIGDYRFLSIMNNNIQNFTQRSDLSQLPLRSKMPGIIGYFQIDENNQFSTPLVPEQSDQAEQYGLSQQDYLERLTQSKNLATILIDNKLMINVNVEIVAPDAVVNSVTSGPEVAQAAVEIEKKTSITFDKLKNQQKFSFSSKLGRVEDLLEDNQNSEFDKRAQLADKKNAGSQRQVISKESSKQDRAKENEEQQAPSRQLRIERNVLAESTLGAVNAAGAQQPITIQLFESEIEPFQVSLLESGHIVIFRRVWTNNQRLIQGMLIDKMRFIESIIQKEFVDSALSQSNRLAIAYQGNFLAAYGEIENGAYGYLDSAGQLSGTLLYQTALLSPFDDFKVVFTLSELSAGASGHIVILSALILLCAVLIGAWLFNRYASAQNRLMQQQQDFISSVSHELKTPLTSIRMYGEILKEGWVSEAKKNQYYHFILDESERLSRLITNVLQLAKLSRNTLKPDIKPQAVSKLISIVESKLSGQALSADFDLMIKSQLVNGGQDIEIHLDEDLFIQIMINLVDNAIKYSSQSQIKKIEVEFSVLEKQQLGISVRDYGPGIELEKLEKIFTLFYRSESELTRETKGTGIGLALVNEYTQLMGGDVSATNKSPGLEVFVKFPYIPLYTY